MSSQTCLYSYLGCLFIANFANQDDVGCLSQHGPDNAGKIEPDAMFDLDLVELLAGVNTNDTANHFGDNDHVTKVCLDEIWFLVGFGLLLGLSQLLNQAHWFSLKAAVEPAASASVHDIPELFGGKVEEPVGRASLEPGSVYGFDGTLWVYAFQETTLVRLSPLS